MISIDENSISNQGNDIKVKLIVKNQNGFDINMFNTSYLDDDLSFDLNSDGVNTIKNQETFERDFVIKLNKSANGEDISALLKSKDITVSFNADSANQNDNLIKIEPKIKI